MPEPGPDPFEDLVVLADFDVARDAEHVVAVLRDEGLGATTRFAIDADLEGRGPTVPGPAGALVEVMVLEHDVFAARRVLAAAGVVLPVDALGLDTLDEAFRTPEVQLWSWALDERRELEDARRRHRARRNTIAVIVGLFVAIVLALAWKAISLLLG
jgi:hypothetical protein